MPKPLSHKLPLLASDLQNLHESGITDFTIRTNGIRTENAAMVFPYRDINGVFNGFTRWRPHNPRLVNGKAAKYEQPKLSTPRAYFPHGSLIALRNSTADIYVTEGEKKALALGQLGIAAIGLGGVFSWSEKGESELIDDLRQIEWTDRRIFIVFDYDEKPETRRNVSLAKRRLASALRSAGASEVRDVAIPSGPNGTKWGVDDFLVANDPASFFELVTEAESVPETDLAISSINLISLTPPNLSEAAYHGVVGDFLKAVRPFTEAADSAVLAHLLPAIGTLIGPGPHVWGGGEQPARINTALVGPTSTGRKGTSFVPVNILMQSVNPEFWSKQCVRGLSSGEGLIQKVSDLKVKNDDGSWSDTSVEKRVHVVEPEFSRVLAQTRREGNILSQVLRESYDSGNLGVLTRNPLSAANAHISITGHITPEELTKRFSEVEMANGFGNRFLWFYVRSDRELPDGDPIPSKLITKFSSRIKVILKGIASLRRVDQSPASQSLWRSVYSGLRKDRVGLQGALLARGESIVLRLSLIYALLDQSNVIRPEHIEAGLAVWQYNEESVRLIFKQKSGNTVADRVYQLLRNGPMVTKQFHDHMNVSSVELRQALQCLVDMGRVTTTKIPQNGPGRPSEQWMLVDPDTVRLIK